MRKTSLLRMDTRASAAQPRSNLMPWSLILTCMLVGSRILALTTEQSSDFWTIWAITVGVISFISPISGIALSLANVFVSLDDNLSVGFSVGQIAGACATARLLIQLAIHKTSLNNIWRSSHFALFAIAFTIMLSAYFSSIPSIPWDILRKLLLIVVLYLLILAYVDTADKLLFVQLTMMLCAGFAALWTLGQPLTDALVDERASGLTGNANYQAIYCAIAMPLVIGVILYIKSVFWRTLAGISGIAIVGAVAASASRGGLVVLVVSMLLIIVAWGKHVRRIQGLISAFIVVIVVIFTASDYAQERFNEALNSLSQGTSQQTESRVQLVDDSLTLWGQYPILGVGPGNWFAGVSRLPTRASGAQSAHVWPAQILAELGVIGFGCYLVFVFLCIHDYRLAIRMVDKQKSPYSDLLRGFFASAVAMSLAWTSGNPYNQLWFELLLLGGISLHISSKV